MDTPKVLIRMTRMELEEVYRLLGNLRTVLDKTPDEKFGATKRFQNGDMFEIRVSPSYTSEISGVLIRDLDSV